MRISLRKKSIVAASFLMILIVSFAYCASQSKASKLATEAISSLKSIRSALKVGVNYSKYNDKVIASQTTIDKYVDTVGVKKFNGFGQKILDVQALYIDSGDLWKFYIDSGNILPYIKEECTVSHASAHAFPAQIFPPIPSNHLT